MKRGRMKQNGRTRGWKRALSTAEPVDVWIAWAIFAIALCIGVYKIIYT